MKHPRRKAVLLITMLLLMLFAVSASAAPAQVTGLKAKVSGTTVSLTWKKASGAQKYYVYSVNTATGKLKKVKTTTSRSYTVKNLTMGQTYSYQVCAVDKKKRVGTLSAVVSATPKIVAPSAPKNFRITTKGETSADLAWSKVSSCDGYTIFEYDETSKSYKVVLDNISKKKSKLVVKFAAGKEHKVYIASYRKIKGGRIYSKKSSILTFTMAKYTDKIKQIRRPYYVVKAKKTMTVENLTKKKKQTVKKGTKLYVTSTKNSVLTGYLTNGNKISVKRSNISFSGMTLDCSKKNDYSKSLKEQFVNTKGYYSPTKYLVWVNELKYKVNVFKRTDGKWKLVKQFPCCIGKATSRTPGGIRRIIAKRSQAPTVPGPVIYFSPGSTGYDNPTGAGFHNQVGTTMSKAVSGACVRLYYSDLMWMYNTLPINTTVVVY